VSFWSGKRLNDRLKRDKLVAPFDDKRIECAAYALGLGAYAFTTSDAKEDEAHKPTVGIIELKERQQISIPPGQFAFLLTEETVTVPPDAIAFISVKTRRKFEGLVNVSGFHVDPGWSSRLIFGVLNAGPSPIVLERAQPLFLLFFADLSTSPAEPLLVDTENVYQKDDGYSNIPPDLIQKMSGSVPSLYRLDRVTRDLKSDLKDVQATARYAMLTGGGAFAISLAVLALIGKTVLFPSTPPATAAVPSPGTSQVTPAMNVTVAPNCPASACVQQETKKEAKSQQSASRPGAH
jgi:dCTP deaminase